MSVQGKKAKDRSNFPTAMSRFCLFCGFVVFWLVFFFKNASCFNFPPRYRSLCALCFVAVPLCAGAALSFSLSLSPSLSLWPTDCHTDCTGRDLCPHVTSLTHTSRHADRNVISFIKTGLHAHCNFI